MPIYRDIYDGPPNGYTNRRTDKRYIVIHNTANDASAADEADYAKRRTDQVSSHYYVDDRRIIQSLDTDLRAWHVGSTKGNNEGISYEITGTNSKSTTWWKNNVAWGPLASSIARDCAHHDIDPVALTLTQLLDGRTTGIITHDMARRVWGGSDHTDPGPNFPMSYLVAAVRDAAGEDDDMAFIREVRKGDENVAVHFLQQRLQAAGYWSGPKTGKYDSKTVAALAACRKAAGSQADDFDVAGIEAWGQVLDMAARAAAR